MSNRNLILNVNPESNGTVRMRDNANPAPYTYGEIRPYERQVFNMWRDRSHERDEWRTVSLDEIVEWLIMNEVIGDEYLNSLTNDKLIDEVQSRSIIPDDVFEDAELQAYARDVNSAWLPEDIFTEAQLGEWARENGYILSSEQ